MRSRIKSNTHFSRKVHTVRDKSDFVALHLHFLTKVLVRNSTSNISVLCSFENVCIVRLVRLISIFWIVSIHCSVSIICFVFIICFVSIIRLISILSIV